MSRRRLRKKLKLLSKVDILRALPAEEVQALAAHMDSVCFAEGAPLIREGGAADGLYFLLEGEVHVERKGRGEIARLGPGQAVGETALLKGSPRTASVVAETPVHALRISKEHFDRLAAGAPKLREALAALAARRAAGKEAEVPSENAWAGKAIRAAEARHRGLKLWQTLMIGGLALWASLALNHHLELAHASRTTLAVLNLVCGLLVIQGACEAFIQGVERLGARLGWDGFTSGTVGSLISTLPEFVVIAFLVKVDPMAAFVTAIVTIYNNSLAFSVYMFFLPKGKCGAYEMPRSLTIAGTEILIAGASVSLILGILMMVQRSEELKSSLGGADLMVIAGVLLVIYVYYLVTLVKFYGEGKDDAESVPPNPDELGHDTRLPGIAAMFALGTVGAYCGGESIGAFAEIALKSLGMPAIPTAAALAFFAGISEYVIVYKSHMRGELGIALSNVFGGLTQVMFLLLPFTMLTVGLLGFAGQAGMAIPINPATTLLVILLFPLFYALHQYMELERNMSNLDAAAMTGIYTLLLYFLFTSPT